MCSTFGIIFGIFFKQFPRFSADHPVVVHIYATYRNMNLNVGFGLNEVLRPSTLTALLNKNQEPNDEMNNAGLLLAKALYCASMQ